MAKLVNKVTIGFVVQEFDEKGKCIAQEFIAASQAEWEDTETGEAIEAKEWYFPFDMKQPE